MDWSQKLLTSSIPSFKCTRVLTRGKERLYGCIAVCREKLWVLGHTVWTSLDVLSINGEVEGGSLPAAQIPKHFHPYTFWLGACTGFSTVHCWLGFAKLLMIPSGLVTAQLRRRKICSSVEEEGVCWTPEIQESMYRVDRESSSWWQGASEGFF